MSFFKIDKIPKDIDIIVVGSGISGLTSAALLSDYYNVVVFEQHPERIGGCLHTFSKNGQKFETGVHYIGNIRNTGADKLLQKLTGENDLWRDLDDVYDKILLADGTKFDVRKGEENYKQDLEQMFPSEIDSINRYFKLCNQVQKTTSKYFTLKFLRNLTISSLPDFTNYKHWSQQTLKETLDNLGMSEKLQKIISYSYGNFGDRPESLSLTGHAMLFNHYKNGAIFPKNGPDTITKGLLNYIKKNGSKVFYAANVVKITPTSVEIESKDGKYAIHADKIISTCGVNNTNSLLGCNNPRYRPSVSHYSMFITFDKTKNTPKSTSNYWCFDENYNGTFINFPCNKVSSSKIGTCHMITTANNEIFNRNKFDSTKEEQKQKMLELLKKEFPVVYGNIKDVDLATPYAAKKYLGSFFSYGISHSVLRKDFDNYFKGIYLAGADTLSSGVVGAFVSGVFVACNIDKRIVWKHLYEIIKI